MMKGKVMRAHQGMMAMPIRRLPWNIPEALVVVGDAWGIQKRAERWGGVRLMRCKFYGAYTRKLREFPQEKKHVS